MIFSSAGRKLALLARKAAITGQFNILDYNENPCKGCSNLLMGIALGYPEHDIKALYASAFRDFENDKKATFEFIQNHANGIEEWASKNLVIHDFKD
ncbi:MAG TPA: hypothetical protein VIH86_13025, partial [Puia sp.]